MVVWTNRWHKNSAVPDYYSPNVVAVTTECSMAWDGGIVSHTWDQHIFLLKNLLYCRKQHKNMVSLGQRQSFLIIVREVEFIPKFPTCFSNKGDHCQDEMFEKIYIHRCTCFSSKGDHRQDEMFENKCCLSFFLTHPKDS